ncbi:aminodeoxychorismate synthase component I [Saccharopolyspora sp. NFXS83]|uniref:aminodeoxychorismate synthase component I n=1 Tax=Saccharopolyspora sp. NFXS83 TaxID=2993560 RepID=UPI00224B8CA2|nr:aminodeoxychorismate synthase component I [Saccharopolyspora sp. NFXS83]MCX2731483.1 aminodeoxychorismate synthase component I [Saccharopolyspora sp. NFXS83]
MASGEYGEVRTLLIDNHDSYTYNLFHQLTEVSGTAPTVVVNDVEPADLELDRYDAVVLSPGAGDPRRPRDFGVCRDVLRKASVPVLGVCLGHQGIAVAEGAEVVRAPDARHGHRSRVRHGGDPLFDGVPAEFGAVRYHSLCVAEPLPPELEPLAWAEDDVLMALRHRTLPRWGVQFHPESIETELGTRLLRNFRRLTCEDRAVQGAAPHGSAERAAPNVSRPVELPPEAASTRIGADVARTGEPPIHYTAHVVTLPAEIDAEAAFAELFASSADAFWLDSSRVQPGLARFSYLGDAAGPLAEVVRHRVGPRQESIFERLRRELARRHVHAPELPFDFVGGYIGYFGYELKAECGSPNRHVADTPDAIWLFADRFLVVDHELRTTYLVALSGPGVDEADARRWLTGTGRALARIRPLPAPDTGGGVALAPLLDRDDYRRDVARCQEHLLAGESYEICLTTSATIPLHGSGFDAYRRLRTLNPAPYSAFLSFGAVEVACSSPERFLKISDGIAEAKPIKGTAPRGRTPDEDERLRAGLAADPKSRAENLMIVDLLRNDLGRVCRPGSVQVPVLRDVESYRTVHQLVSTVRGELADGRDALDCVRACFPGGSMTGAPKLRTMELIDELEGAARGVYSGALGFLSCNGNADLNIVIRTLVRTGDRWRVGAGGAVVLASDPTAEYEEMLLKATTSASAAPASGLF